MYIVFFVHSNIFEKLRWKVVCTNVLQYQHVSFQLRALISALISALFFPIKTESVILLCHQNQHL